ncbi:rho guanine nucleotide exchange factor 10-like protein isoform X1 [Takifugu flavidus]|uniref:rho guanine nucleotide exchange factor 10-like protein isoform X1 n=2 Tax=Takifugu flavidus TaxID=433684 RepID=UPI0025440F2B|nr:rho guanine nucleotide exchange factor 10-like protein isoform X1 [Takifugu flavidus]XP_056897172.1 rho guanine nucleotide exchange factor 10-like protein isoform X1 [Takifugu flavidus]XP_056897173.1 rho guanine nucleotide exchange factor 10-like protein isoform X1 [Takifugu flavidus]
MIRRARFLQRKERPAVKQEDEAYLDVSVCPRKPPPALLSLMPEGLSGHQVLRRLILNSILQSESSYLSSLNRIVQEYQKPLLEPQNLILNHRKVHRIFYRVQEIHHCHAMFQIALASRVADWDSSERIGDLFVASFSKTLVLNVYSDYINNFTHSMALLKKACMSKPVFLDFLKKKQASSPDRITLYGLMVKPIQRFPQFILLLQDMLRNTPVGHGDRLPLQLALTELETLAEKLNEQKRLSDQEAEVQQLTHSGGAHNLRKLLASEQKHLIHSELLTEVIFDEKGQVLKSRDRKLFLLNDTLICANVNLKGPAGSKYSVKWVSSVMQTQVVEVGEDSLQTIDGVTVVQPYSSFCRPAGHVFLGPSRSYQQLEELQHDLAVVQDVSLLVRTLRGTYQNLNSTVCEDWSLALQRLIRLKEEEIQNVNKCRLRLAVPASTDRSGRPVKVTVVFNTPNPLSKLSWVNHLHLAKVAQGAANCPGWECAEEHEQTKVMLTFPLLSSRLPVLRSQTVKASLHCPSQSSLIGFCRSSTSLPQGYLWVAGGGGTSNQGQVEIFSLNRSAPRLVKTVATRAAVVCLEYVREERGSAAPELQNLPAPGNIICAGLQDGSIQVYGSVDTAVQNLLVLLTPGGGPVVSLKHLGCSLFAGLANGDVAVYHQRPGESLWDVDSCRLLSVGSDSVCSLLGLEDSVWASCANQVTVIQESSLQTQRFQAHSNPGYNVEHMVRSGGGVWMAFSRGSSIHLFHTESLELLQEVNIAPRSAHLAAGQLWVSSLLVCQGLLWVGTSQGVIICFPVPTLEGIPKITGKGITSLTAHCGPVDFLVAAHYLLTSDLLRQDSTNMKDEDNQGHQGQRGAAPQAEEPPGFLLQYRLRSTCQLPGKLLSSQAEPDGPKLHTEPPEHGPEDGSIYAVSEDPDVWVRGRAAEWGSEGEARRSSVVSTAVFSGGRGHRRLGGSSAGDPEKMENTLLVWQLPLTASHPPALHLPR